MQRGPAPARVRRRAGRLGRCRPRARRRGAMAKPSSIDVVEVILRNGRTLRLRAPGHGDRDARAACLSALSAESLHKRFHAGLKARAAHVVRYIVYSCNKRGALNITMADNSRERIIANASYA